MKSSTKREKLIKKIDNERKKQIALNAMIGEFSIW